MTPAPSTSLVEETEINIVSTQTELEGKLHFDRVCRVHGKLRGEIVGKPGSLLILAENGVMEGTVFADSILIEGFVRGDIEATTRVRITQTGRVIGNIKTPVLSVDFGSHFEGSCKMEDPDKRGRGFREAALASPV